MDKLSNNPQLGDLNSIVTNEEETENVKSRASPVFKCINLPKTVRESHLDSSDYDIPSYQVNQSIKSRTSSKSVNETSESVLPFSPIFSPIPVASTAQFQPPSIHSLATIAKNVDKCCQNTMSSRSNINRIKILKPCEVFESLGMTDKDVSWVSSMASPPPKQLPGSEFNTVEKATFLPEDNFQKIQPRALFSPDSDDGFGCHPIGSTPTQDNEEEYQTNIRLSDVCATLRELEVKSLDQVSNDSVEKVIIKKDQIISPVIQTRKKKCDFGKTKKKASLVKSPERVNKYEFAVGENLQSLDCESIKHSKENNFIEDDSFQSMSFSVIDELCKTLVSEQSSYSVTTKSPNCDKTLVNSSLNDSKHTRTVKKFYSSKTTSDVYAVSSMDNLHSYARALEENDKCSLEGSKIDQSFAEKGIVRVDIFNKDSCKIDETKFSHSEKTKGNDPSLEKKIKKENNLNSSWDSMKQYLSESQLNISDGEIFRTVENLEKTLAGSKNKSLEGLNTEGIQDEEAVSSQNLGQVQTSVEVSSITVNETKNEPSKFDSDLSKMYHTKDAGESFLSVPVPAPFTTASGTKILVSEKALSKTKEIFQDCDETFKIDKQIFDSTNSYGRNKECHDSVCDFENVLMKGFSTGSGKLINVSAEALKKAKTLMSECESIEGMQEETTQNQTDEFLISSGKQNHIPKNFKSFTSESNENEKDQFVFANAMSGFLTGSGKKIQVSAAALDRARTLMIECGQLEENYLKSENDKDSGNMASINRTFKTESNKDSKENIKELPISLMEGFSTVSGKAIQVSAEALEKAKCFLDDPDERSNENIFKGFSAGSGKNISVSYEPLEEIKLFKQNCEQVVNKSCNKLSSEWVRDIPNQTSSKNSRSEELHVCFSTALGNKVKVCSKALEKAKELWSKENPLEIPDSKEFPPSKGQEVMGFATAAGNKVTISESALAKAKERMNQIETENLRNHVNTDKSLQKNAKEISEETSKPEEMSNMSRMEESNDLNEIIPSWIHVYNTSPSIACENEFSPPKCDENQKARVPDRKYIVKSPIFGSFDRFQKKTKRRKLEFEGEIKNTGKKPSAKRTSTLSLDFSVPFKKIKMADNPIVNVKDERARAREEQEKAIKQKDRVEPLKGSYLNRKSSEKQTNWKEAVGKCAPELYSDEYLKNFGVSEDVLKINIENAVSFRFSGENFFGSSCTTNTTGFAVGDGCLLILDEENKFGVEELKRAFLASPGVQPNLVPQGWVENHVKWIVWKLAHYERSFPQYFAGCCLTPNQIMFQLKYRYDREIDRNERSALKKILERDDTPAKRLVLCICGIKKITIGETWEYELQLTDGWYSCPAHCDPAMTRLIEKGKLSIGTKLLIQGAILINCEQGVSPLENNGHAYLKISTNSTRRMRWHVKLGFQKIPENFPVSLGSILSQGGPISRIDIIVVRLYPILYMEKTSDGRHVTRNRRSEEKAQYEYIRMQEQRMETICNEIQSEMKKSSSFDKKNNNKSLNNLDQAEDLCQLVESSSDPSVMGELSASQRILLEKFQLNQSRELTEKIEKKLEKEKLNKRNVSEFLRLKIVDFRKPDFNNSALLSVWNPSEDVASFLSEGKVISLMNVTINNSRIYKPLQINTTRQTQFREINRNVKYPARKLTQIRDISSTICPAFEEVDIVGMIAFIRDIPYGSRLSQVVYLTDLEMNFVGVVFWGSCKDYGWENALKIPSVVACSNLQWKKNYTHPDVPSVYANENSVFTENPKHSYLKEEMERLKQMMPENKIAFLSKCEEDLTTKLEDSKWRTNRSKNLSANDSGIREASKSRSVNGFESRPTASSTPIKQFSSKVDSDEAEPSPIQKRIEKLQSYGEPPSLIPLLIRNNTKRIIKKKS